MYDSRSATKRQGRLLLQQQHPSPAILFTASTLDAAVDLDLQLMDGRCSSLAAECVASGVLGPRPGVAPPQTLTAFSAPSFVDHSQLPPSPSTMPPGLFSALHGMSTQAPHGGGGHWFMDTGASTHMASNAGINSSPPYCTQRDCCWQRQLHVRLTRRLCFFVYSRFSSSSQ